MRNVSKWSHEKFLSRPGRIWALGLLVWTLVVIAAVRFLSELNPEQVPQLVLLQDQAEARVPVLARLSRWLWLIHLSLYRAYPWIFVTPYVLGLTSLFLFERGRLRWSLPVQLLACVACIATVRYLGRVISASQPRAIIVAMTHTIDDHGPSGPRRDVLRQISRTNHVRADGFFSRVEVKDDVRHVLTLMSNFLSGSKESTDSNAPLVPPPDFFGHTRGPAEDARIEVRAVRRVGTNDAPSDPPAWTQVQWDGGHKGARFSRFISGEPPVGVLSDLFVYGALVGLAHAVHFHRRYRDREHRALSLETHLVRTRLHALQAQLQPHFLFNALNSVTSLLREDPRAAEEMLISLSDLLRVALTHSESQESTLRGELRFLDLYIQIQQVRFGDRLSYHPTVEEESLDCAIPTFLLQPLVENAIRHGIEPTGRPGTIRLTARREKQVLCIEVADDGLGCEMDNTGSPAHIGVGLSNVRARVESLYPSESRVSFMSSPSAGFTVRIEIPARVFTSAGKAANLVST